MHNWKSQMRPMINELCAWTAPGDDRVLDLEAAGSQH